MKSSAEVPQMARFRMRFDPETGVYRDCKWCHGDGCLACPAEADKAYKEDFPEGAQPIMTISAAEFERADIDEAMGTSNIETTHGLIGRIAQLVWDARERSSPNSLKEQSS